MEKAKSGWWPFDTAKNGKKDTQKERNEKSSKTNPNMVQ